VRNSTAVMLWIGSLTVGSALVIGAIVYLVKMGLSPWWCLPMIVLGRYFLGLYNAVNRNCERLLDSERAGGANGARDYGFSALD
jgi:hypothetical protein